MPDNPIGPPWTCPSCDGSGEFKWRYRSEPDVAPCFFCNATGDQRQMPQAWRACPSRNRAAYHESMR